MIQQKYSLRLKLAIFDRVTCIDFMYLPRTKLDLAHRLQTVTLQTHFPVDRCSAGHRSRLEQHSLLFHSSGMLLTTAGLPLRGTGTTNGAVR